MRDEIEFPQGLIVKAPNEKAPDFVKGKISINRKELGNWLRGKEDEWINLDIKVSKEGKWYSSVDNWVPEGEKKEAPAGKPDFDDDVPF